MTPDALNALESVVKTVLQAPRGDIPETAANIESRWLQQLAAGYSDLKEKHAQLEAAASRARLQSNEDLRKLELANRELETRDTHQRERLADALKRAHDADEKCKTLLAGMEEAQVRAATAIRERNEATGRSEELESSARLLAGHAAGLGAHVVRLEKALKNGH
jgi:chromosome segregation ATPase